MINAFLFEQRQQEQIILLILTDGGGEAILKGAFIFINFLLGFETAGP